MSCNFLYTYKFSQYNYDSNATMPIKFQNVLCNRHNIFMWKCVQAFECFLCTRVKYQFEKGSGINADREENSSQQENSLQRSSVTPGRFLTPNPGKGEIFQLARKSRVMPSQFPSNTLRTWNSILFSFIHFPAKYEPFLVRNCINFSKLLLLRGWLSMKPEGRERNLMKYKLRGGYQASGACGDFKERVFYDFNIFK